LLLVVVAATTSPAILSAQGTAHQVPSSGAGEPSMYAGADAEMVAEQIGDTGASAAFDRAAVFGLSGALRVAVIRSGDPVDPMLLAGAGHGGGRFEWVPLLGTKRT